MSAERSPERSRQRQRRVPSAATDGSHPSAVAPPPIAAAPSAERELALEVGRAEVDRARGRGARASRPGPRSPIAASGNVSAGVADAGAGSPISSGPGGSSAIPDSSGSLRDALVVRRGGDRGVGGPSPGRVDASLEAGDPELVGRSRGRAPRGDAVRAATTPPRPPPARPPRSPRSGRRPARRSASRSARRLDVALAVLGEQQASQRRVPAAPGPGPPDHRLVASPRQRDVGEPEVLAALLAVVVPRGARGTPALQRDVDRAPGRRLVGVVEVDGLALLGIQPGSHRNGQ